MNQLEINDINRRFRIDLEFIKIKNKVLLSYRTPVRRDQFNYLFSGRDRVTFFPILNNGIFPETSVSVVDFSGFILKKYPQAAFHFFTAAGNFSGQFLFSLVINESDTKEDLSVHVIPADCELILSLDPKNVYFNLFLHLTKPCYMNSES